MVTPAYVTSYLSIGQVYSKDSIQQKIQPEYLRGRVIIRASFEYIPSSWFPLFHTVLKGWLVKVFTIGRRVYSDMTEGQYSTCFSLKTFCKVTSPGLRFCLCNVLQWLCKDTVWQCASFHSQMWTSVLMELITAATTVPTLRGAISAHVLPATVWFKKTPLAMVNSHLIHWC